MLKRLVVAAIVMLGLVFALGAVIRVSNSVRWRPKNGTLAYHKGMFIDEGRREHFLRVSRSPVRFWRQFVWQNPAKRRAFHERALFEKGYLATRVVPRTKPFPLTRISADEVEIKGMTWYFISINTDGTNATITAPADIVDQIAEVVRDSDGDPTSR